MPSKAEKLLESMRTTYTNRRSRDIATVLQYFGFVSRSGAKHDIFIHEVWPHLRYTLPRQRIVKPKYGHKLVTIVDELSSLRNTIDESQ